MRDYLDIPRTITFDKPVYCLLGVLKPAALHYSISLVATFDWRGIHDGIFICIVGGLKDENRMHLGQRGCKQHDLTVKCK